MLYFRRASSWVRKCSRSRTFPQVAVRQISNVPKHKFVHNKDNPFVTVSDEIRAAINEGKPVVALETAIYTHGFPYPENIALASHLESVVRLHGGIPATIGILNGVAHVGLGTEQIIELASSAGRPETMKVSTRDLSYICGLGFCGKKLNGGTTVAGTMALAHGASIKVFATGGLGGVHRGASNSMDVSADLVELERTPVTVVSSGCKSFLDIPKTLEFLETQGVTVGTFADGRDGNIDFPAFWTRDSGIRSPMVLQNEEEAAAMMYAKKRLRIQPSMLLANPIPAEHSIDRHRMDTIIAEAISDAERQGITGHANTPFILSRIRELTGGDSIPANKALIDSNVARGTRLAVEYAKLERRSSQEGAVSAASKPLASSVGHKPTRPSKRTQLLGKADVVAAGSLAVDLACDYAPEYPSQGNQTPQPATSNPAVITQSLGGVAQNVATAMHYLGTSVRLCSVVGEDAAGVAARELLDRRGMQTAGVKQIKGGARTSQYVAVNDTHKNLVGGMADMKILETDAIDFDEIWRPELSLAKPKWLVVDSNWNPSALYRWISAGKALGAKVAFEPVSAEKCKRLLHPQSASVDAFAAVPENMLSLATPNALELASMHSAAAGIGLFEREDWWRVIDAMGMSSAGSREKLVSMTNSSLVDEGVPQQSIQLLPFIPSILTKLGSRGVLMTQLLAKDDVRLTARESAPYILSHSTDEVGLVGGVYMRLFPVAEVVAKDDIVSVNGVGDTFLGIILAGLAKERPKDWPELIEAAQRGSVMTLKRKESVSPEIATLRPLISDALANRV